MRPRRSLDLFPDWAVEITRFSPNKLTQKLLLALKPASRTSGSARLCCTPLRSPCSVAWSMLNSLRAYCVDLPTPLENSGAW